MRLLLSALLLTGCSTLPPDERLVRLMLVKQGTSADAELKRLCGDDRILEPMGCAKIASTRCTIVVKDVRGGYDDHETLSAWGHELRHCFFGPVHD